MRLRHSASRDWGTCGALRALRWGIDIPGDGEVVVERVVTRSRGTVLAAEAEAARTWWSRGKGLLGRRGLPEGGGLIIAPCSSIHTWFMAFPIDVAFVAADGRVVRTAHALRPWRFGPFARQVRYVVELPAGALARSGTEPGDILAILEAGPVAAEAHPPT